MTGPRARQQKHPNVLDGLPEREAGLLVLSNFKPQRAEALGRTQLADVALRGVRAVRTGRGGKK